MISKILTVSAILVLGAILGLGIFIFSKAKKKEAYYLAGQFLCSELTKDKDTGALVLNNCEPVQGEKIGKTSIYNPVNVLKIEE